MSTATVSERVTTIPSLARLGFGDGWLVLPPTFLNLKRPVVIIDRAYTGDPDRYGLEPFGTRNPTIPPPWTHLTIHPFGDRITIRERAGMIMATTSLGCGPDLISGYADAVLLVGHTYELESTWAALWTMSIGRVSVERSTAGTGGSR